MREFKSGDKLVHTEDYISKIYTVIRVYAEKLIVVVDGDADTNMFTINHNIEHLSEYRKRKIEQILKENSDN